MTSEIQAKAAQQIAAATRMLVMEGLMDYSGHVSLRLPGTNNFLIQPASDSRGELEPDRILTVDMKGAVVEGGGRPPLEVALHTEILRARPDINAVLHCHMDLAIAFTLMKGVTLMPMRSHADRWASGIPTHADPSHIISVEQGQSLARTLGPHNGALIRAHGIVLVAESVPALFVDAIHFLENAKALMMVLQAGQEPVPLTGEEIAMIDRKRDFHVQKLWNFYVRQGKSRGVIPEAWSAAV